MYLCSILYSSINKTMLSTYVFYKLIAIYSTYHIATISCCQYYIPQIRYIMCMDLNTTLTSPCSLVFVVFPHQRGTTV